MEPIGTDRRVSDVDAALGATDDAIQWIGIAPSAIAHRTDFSDFYQRFAASVTNAVAVTLGDDELAVDAVAEAMARAWDRWAKIGDYDKPEAWVYRVALNWAFSWRRRRRRERERPVALGPSEVVAELRDDSLDQALRALSVEQRAVVVCRLYFDWSVATTAEALGVSEGTVKSRLARALDQLRRAVERDDGTVGGSASQPGGMS